MGHHNRVFHGDRYALDGAWSPPTSAANFCEEDYAVSRYVAEFINSISNLAYIILALQYMYGPGSQGLWKPRCDFMSVSLFTLGVGSFLFHASLRQNLQYVDDLSMLLAASAMLHGLFTVRATPAQRYRNSALLALIVGGFSAFYVWSGTIIYHTLAFATQILVLTFRCLYLFRWQERKFPEDKVRSWNTRRWQASGICLVGYILWNIDLEFCAQLRAFRAEIGLPWAWLFELHGWWHLLTAIGANHFIKVVREIRDEEAREKAAPRPKQVK